MHPDKHFRVEDRDLMLTFLRRHPFATICASVKGSPMIAQAPVVVREIGEEIALDFHLSRGSVLAPHIVQGFRAVILAAGEDAYISPDWYANADQVPTWNYVSVEAEGSVAALSRDELIAQADALSALEEGRLKPKKPWTRAKMTPGKFDAMLRGIVGARLVVDRLRGTFKLSQNKAEEDRAGAAAALGDHPIAALMRKA
jgi:transcriptional regulator